MSKLNVLPPAAVAWLTVWQQARALSLSGGTSVAHRLAEAGHNVFAMTSDHPEARRLQAMEGVTAVVARPEAMPLDPSQFDVVVTHDGFHRLDHDAALWQVARVLRTGGCLSASYVIRDDSVPWVRRLAALLRHYDPMAMRGNFGHESLEKLRTSHYFPEVEERAFRIWQPVSLPDLQAMVAKQPLAANLTDEQRARLTAEVGDLFHASVRPGQELRLPYQLLCVRAFVDHAELTTPVVLAESGIDIRM